MTFYIKRLMMCVHVGVAIERQIFVFEAFFLLQKLCKPPALCPRVSLICHLNYFRRNQSWNFVCKYVKTTICK